MRKEMLILRNSIDKCEKEEKDKLIFDKLVNSRLYKDAKSIFIYVSYGSEVDTIKIINDALFKGKRVYIPKTIKEKKEMIAVNISTLSGLIVDEHGILEPKTVDKNNIADNFDLILMPGLAFDMFGNRVGYGGGYYDRFIHGQKNSNIKVALSYNIQIVDKITAEEHDIKVNYVITEDKIIKI